MPMSKEEWLALKQRHRQQMEAADTNVGQAQEPPRRGEAWAIRMAAFASAVAVITVIERTLGALPTLLVLGGLAVAGLLYMAGPWLRANSDQLGWWLIGALLLGVAATVVAMPRDRSKAIYDKAGRRVGTTVTKPDGRIELYDPDGKMRGWIRRHPDGRHEVFGPDGYRLGWYNPVTRQYHHDP